MEVLLRLKFCYVVLVLLTLNNGVNNNPVSARYSLYDSVSNEDTGLTYFTKKIDCLENEVGGINSDFDSEINCTPEISSDYNAMSNDVPGLTESTDKNLTRNKGYNATCTENRSSGYNEVSESETSVLTNSYNFSDDTYVLVFEQSDDDIDTTIPDDILYEDMPGIWIVYVAHDEDEFHNIEVEHAAEFIGDEKPLNLIRAVQSVADVISGIEKSPEEDMEWTGDTELEEPQRVVENGYIFYDMGSQE